MAKSWMPRPPATTTRRLRPMRPWMPTWRRSPRTTSTGSAARSMVSMLRWSIGSTGRSLPRPLEAVGFGASEQDQLTGQQRDQQHEREPSNLGYSHPARSENDDDDGALQPVADE